jgi:D-lactate dehydrogenase
MTIDVRIAMFSARQFDRDGFSAAIAERAAVGAGQPVDGLSHVRLDAIDDRLSLSTVRFAEGAEAVCVFVNDDVSAPVVAALADCGVRTIALRCAGFNNVDLDAAARAGLRVVRVPAYSPNAVAEHTIALILALNRKICRASNRVRDRNFSLDGLVGFDLAGKTVGVVGTGRIGALVARLLWHFRCHVLCFDPIIDPALVELGVRYVVLDDIWSAADIVSLNCPLTETTHHLISADVIARMKRGAMVVNTGRGGLVDTQAVIEGLKTGQIGSVALDVYEEEAELFFEDRSTQLLLDDTFARLLTFPNVLITAHQAFLTREALAAIADTTLSNIDLCHRGEPCPNAVHASP